MKKSRYTESQIISILEEVCREYGMLDVAYYSWKSKYGGMEASDIRRLKELEDENRRFKQMFANLSLEHNALKDIDKKSSNRY